MSELARPTSHVATLGAYGAVQGRVQARRAAAQPAPYAALLAQRPATPVGSGPVPGGPGPAVMPTGLAPNADTTAFMPRIPGTAPATNQPRIPGSVAVPAANAPRAAAPTLDDLEGRTGGTLPTDMESWGTTAPAGPTTAEVQPTQPAGGATRRIDTVLDLQRALRSAGFDPGPLDGQMGPRTDYAIRRFQASRGLQVDGAAGARTLAALGDPGDDEPVRAKRSGPAPVSVTGLQSRLTANLHNRYRGRVHQCFRYAWATATQAGGRGIGSAQASHVGRYAGISHLNTMISQGQVRTGDVIYVNRRPGADPSSTNLAYGPHWFVYVGNGRFADQYGVRDADAMANFVPGRKIDTIYHPFA